METKTAKITSVQENQRQFEYQGTKHYEHWVKYEGSEIVHTYASKSEKCEKFKVGETATFDIDIKQNGSHTNYKIKPKSDGFGGGGGKKFEPKDSGIITYLSVFSSACNYHAQRTCSQSDVFDMAEEAFKRAMSKTTLTK